MKNNLPTDNEIIALIRNIKYAIGNEVMREAFKSGTYAKHGRHYKNLPNQSSAPYESFARQSGKLSDSLDVEVTSDLIKVGSVVPYLKYLELGTYLMKPRPTLKLSYEKTNINKIIDDKIKSFFR